MKSQSLFIRAYVSTEEAVLHLKDVYNLLSKSNPLAAQGIIPILKQAIELRDMVAPLSELVADDE